VQNTAFLYTGGVKRELLQHIELLRSAGLRATPQRCAVLAVLAARRQPVSVAALVRASRNAFDMTTAYRTLDALEKRSLVRRIGIDRERATFELARGHHHHAICSSCGMVRDISICITPGLDEAVQRTARFAHIERHSLEFFGICRACTTSKRT
jgi:Fe2+ or Zn2+ uptake regulation protein